MKRLVAAPMLAALGLFAGCLSEELVPSNRGEPFLSSIEIASPSTSLANGTRMVLKANGTLSTGLERDLTQSATWASTNPLVATVEGGQLLGHKIGRAIISASVDGIVARVPFEVTAATLVSLSLAPASASVALGLHQQFLVTGLFTDGTYQDLSSQAKWESSNARVALSNDDGAGAFYTLGQGSATISAKVGKLASAAELYVGAATLTGISVRPSSDLIEAGGSEPLQAVGVYSDGSALEITDRVEWRSSDPAVASVSNEPGLRGLVKGWRTGAVSISATREGVVGWVPMSVQGVALLSISVTPNQLSIPKGLAFRLRATGRYADGGEIDLSRRVTWTSSNRAVIYVSNAPSLEGRAQAIAIGGALLTARLGTVFSATEIEVGPPALASMALSLSNPRVTVGREVRLQAIGTYSDGSQFDLTDAVYWNSSNDRFAAAHNEPGARGLLSALVPGVVTLTAEYPPFSVSTPVRITAASLVKIVIAGVGAPGAIGDHQLRALGTYSDGVSEDITARANWSSSAVWVGSVSNLAGEKGVLTVFQRGQVVISAVLDGVYGALVLSP